MVGTSHSKEKRPYYIQGRKKYWKTTHKFCIEVPNAIDGIYEVDRTTGTTFWTDAIAKEMKNVRIVFEKLEAITEQ